MATPNPLGYVDGSIALAGSEVIGSHTECPRAVRCLDEPAGTLFLAVTGRCGGAKEQS
jgi:hypothetical protein